MRRAIPLRWAASAAAALVFCGRASAAAPAAAETCAESVILAAAKTNVAKNFGDAAESGGQCAYGVRTSLQLSGVGGIAGGIGNAIDFVKSLPGYGFVAAAGTDPNSAVPGSVIVFAGPDSASYLATGKFGSPPGDWLGHVTIKGDDGFYYTDARTVEAAIGWEKGADVEGIRTVAGIFVPGAALVAQYAGRCPKPAEPGAALRPVNPPWSLSPDAGAPPRRAAPVASAPTNCADCAAAESSARDFSALDYRDEADRRAGYRLTSDVVRQFQSFLRLGPGDAERLPTFRGLLPALLEAGPYDGEGRLTGMLAQAVGADPALRAAYDAYVRATDASDCKTRRLTASVERSACLTKLGVVGQDFVGASPVGAASSCVAPFDYLSCVDGR